MINIAVCDDEPNARGVISRFCSELVQSKTSEHASIKEYDNPVDMLADVEKLGAFDLILCDVYMPGLLGTEAVQELRDSGDRSRVVFLTTSQEHAVDAFALHADNYLVKPVSKDVFDNAVGEVLDKILAEKTSYFAAKSHGKIVRIDFSDIIYVQTEGNYQKINISGGAPVEVRMTSKEIAEILCDDQRFFKLGSSCVVNMDEVRYVDGKDVMLTTGEKLHIPVRLVSEFSDTFFDYVMYRDGM